MGREKGCETMSDYITLALICIFGPVAALIGLTIFFYVLDKVDDEITRRENEKAMKQLHESLKRKPRRS
jgi:hypothetical protein